MTFDELYPADMAPLDGQTSFTELEVLASAEAGETWAAEALDQLDGGNR